MKKKEEGKMSIAELKTADDLVFDFFQIGDDAATMAGITVLTDLWKQNMKNREKETIRKDPEIEQRKYNIAREFTKIKQIKKEMPSKMKEIKKRYLKEKMLEKNSVLKLQKKEPKEHDIKSQEINKNMEMTKEEKFRKFF